MNNWRKTTLGDVCELLYGKSLTANKREKGNIPVYSSAGITGWHNKPLVNNRGIIVGRKGTVGTVYLSEVPFYCIDTAYYILPNDDIYNFKYLYYRLKSLGLNKLNEDSAVPGLNRDNAYSQEFNLPPLDEQKRIADVLSALDDKIEINNKINENLEAQAQAIFKQWFVDFEFPDEEGKPYKSNGGKFIDSELGQIPEGWKVGTLGEIANISSGKRPQIKQDKKTDDVNIPLVGASCIMGYTDSFLYNKPIIVTGRVGTHGVIQRFNMPCYPSDNTLVLTTDNYEFTYQTLKTIDFKSLNIGSTQPLITQTHLKNIDIVIPDNDLIQQFEAINSTLFDKIEINIDENKNLSEIRDSLLPKLMSGEVRV
jgi:type I restriction enzyme S subunit